MYGLDAHVVSLRSCFAAAKKALYEFLHQNEANKAIKEQAKREAWEEDAYFQQAWRDVLDKQDRERTERYARTHTHTHTHARTRAR